MLLRGIILCIRFSEYVDQKGLHNVVCKKAVLTIHILIVSISDGKIQLWAFLAETPKGTDNSAPRLSRIGN